jgi:hypothetical protein
MRNNVVGFVCVTITACAVCTTRHAYAENRLQAFVSPSQVAKLDETWRYRLHDSQQWSGYYRSGDQIVLADGWYEIEFKSISVTDCVRPSAVVVQVVSSGQPTVRTGEYTGEGCKNAK